MRIACPYCGERSNDEFTVLGDAAALLARPTTGAPEAFDSYLHERINAAGRHDELWYHGGGCRQWLTVTRDTRTHEIFAVTFARVKAGPVS